MIKTLSPHIKTIPWISPSSVTIPEKYILEIYIWNGDKTSVPISTPYNINNVNPLARLGNSFVNISNYINDILTTELYQSSTTQLISTNSQVWVKTQVIYYIGGVAQTPEFQEIDLAIKGYTYGMDGVNGGTPSNGVLSPVNELKVNSDSFFTIPVFLSETLDTDITVISYPNNVINEVYNEPLTIDSTNSVKAVWINVSEAVNEEFIEINYNGNVVCTLLIKTELRYSPKDIFFVDKEGQLQSVTFFKEKKDTIELKSESYENGSGQPLDGVHQVVDYNQSAKVQFTINTGFISEDNNEVIKQLLIKKQSWIYDGSIYTPVRVTSSSTEFKTRQRDRLINYTIDFDYAFNEVNNI
tara:strand:- start:2247 stop:3314 length:1068 start_codon:yes stop_codon:yes gene_type:complete